MTESELAIEIHEEYQKDAFIKIDFNDLPKVNKEMYLKVARHVHKLIVRGKIEELKKFRIMKITSSYHGKPETVKVEVVGDVDKRISQLEKELKGGEDEVLH